MLLLTEIHHFDIIGQMQRKLRGGFPIGSKVVYPSHGLGVIERIEKREISGGNTSFYVIRIPKKGMTIMAPIKHASSAGVRCVIAKNDVPKVMKILKSSSYDDHEPNWNKRQKSYFDRIKTGSIFEVASVLKTLNRFKINKGLSYVEQQVFENAYQLIISELAEAKGVEEEKIIKTVTKALGNGASGTKSL
ncbi:MAG TPA: CarD family transcriptional regulator [Nitrospinota bacterium]|nr:CarD family transcriptional regulator [Nitrospinota bacterium]|tara:strand:+ start:232106 stop:232678 length:573 start_codon:yes stop_codon:yes gene_type:complete